MAQKIIVLCKRKHGLSDDDLRAKQAEHAELVRAFGSAFILKYQYSFAQANPDGSAPLADLVAEATVTSVADYFAGLETAEGQAAVAHAGSYLSDVQFILVEETTVWG